MARSARSRSVSTGSAGSSGRRRRLVAVLAGSATLLAMAPVALASITPSDGGHTRLVTTGASGTGWGDKTSTRARISEDGNYVVYQSAAQNLTNDVGGGIHVYFTDLSGQVVAGANHTELVDADATKPTLRCKTKGGTNGQSTINEVSNKRGGDGPWVVFNSNCVNLVPGWTHGGDVFIRNMSTGAMDVVSRDIGVGATVSVRPVVDDTGRFVAWNTTTGDVYVRDMLSAASNRTVRVVRSTGGDDESLRPEISGDGTHLIFASDAKLAANDTNSHRDVYVVDLSSWIANHGVTSFSPQLADVDNQGRGASLAASRPGINHDGSIVTWETSASMVGDDTNGVLDAYWRNLTTRQTVLVSRQRDGSIARGQSSRPQVDDSGYVVGFVSPSNGMVGGDTNGRPDAFLRVLSRSNPANGTTYLLSQDPNGDTAGASDDCADPAVASSGTTPSLGAGAVTPTARPGNSNISTRPYLSGDGTHMVFVSGMCDLVRPVTDGVYNQIYVRSYPGGVPAAPAASR